MIQSVTRRVSTLVVTGGGFLIGNWKGATLVGQKWINGDVITHVDGFIVSRANDVVGDQSLTSSVENTNCDRSIVADPSTLVGFRVQNYTSE